MQNNKKRNNNDRIIIGISQGYIQDFVEANYGRKLTGSELEELSWLVWDNGDDDLLNWISKAVNQVLTPEQILK